MNTHTNFDINDNTSAGFWHRAIAAALMAIGLTGTAIGLAAISHADDSAAPPNVASSVRAESVCKTDPFGPFGSWRRTLCDGPVAGDGSWSRERTVVVPAHYTTPLCTSRSSSRSYSSYSDCTGGYVVNERLLNDETYPVRPETVLPDEPGHLG